MSEPRIFSHPFLIYVSSKLKQNLGQWYCFLTSMLPNKDSNASCWIAWMPDEHAWHYIQAKYLWKYVLNKNNQVWPHEKYGNICMLLHRHSHGKMQSYMVDTAHFNDLYEIDYCFPVIFSADKRKDQFITV
jgi:hypothetical protein